MDQTQNLLDNPQQPQSSKPHWHFPLPTWAWVSILIVAAFAVGYWTWMASLEDEPVDSTQNTAGDETAGQKIYRNGEYGVEFKYPAEFFAEQVGSSVLFWPSQGMSSRNSQEEQIVFVLLFGTTNVEKAEDWVKEQYFGDLAMSLSSISAGEAEGVRYTFEEGLEETACEGATLEKDFTLFSFHIGKISGSCETAAEILDGVLSSFHLIPSGLGPTSPEIDHWQAYFHDDGENSYTIFLPTNWFFDVNDTYFQMRSVESWDGTSYQEGSILVDVRLDDRKEFNASLLDHTKLMVSESDLGVLVGVPATFEELNLNGREFIKARIYNSDDIDEKGVVYTTLKDPFTTYIFVVYGDDSGDIDILEAIISSIK